MEEFTQGCLKTVLMGAYGTQEPGIHRSVKLQTWEHLSIYVSFVLDLRGSLHGWMLWIFWIELDVSYQMVLPKIATMVNSYAAWPPHSSVYWRRCYGISQYMMRILNSQMIMWLVPSSHNHIHSWLLRSLNEQNANLLRGKIVRSFVIYLLLDTSLQTTGQKSKCWNAKHSLYFENEL